MGARPGRDLWHVRCLVGAWGLARGGDGEEEAGVCEGRGGSREEALEAASLLALHLFDPTGGPAPLPFHAAHGFLRPPHPL